jgi:hydroxyacylglutathione hydrolase
MLLAALNRCAALPPDTLVYGGHEYTVDNYRFTATIEPHNSRVIQKLAEARALRAAGNPTVPTPLAEELRLNPFLRVADPAIGNAVGLPNGDPVAVLAELRRRKNSF